LDSQQRYEDVLSLSFLKAALKKGRLKEESLFDNITLFTKVVCPPSFGQDVDIQPIFYNLLSKTMSTTMHVLANTNSGTSGSSSGGGSGLEPKTSNAHLTPFLYQDVLALLRTASSVKKTIASNNRVAQDVVAALGTAAITAGVNGVNGVNGVKAGNSGDELQCHVDQIEQTQARLLLIRLEMIGQCTHRQQRCRQWR
jgi:truncated hemoglobin YjbI